MSVEFSFPVCFFNPKVMFLDDKKTFTEQLKMDLEDTVNCVFSQNPSKALHEVKSSPSYQDVFFIYKKHLKEQFDSGDIDPTNAIENLGFLSNFREKMHGDLFSVVFSDHDMAEMNGEEFLRGAKADKLGLLTAMITSGATVEQGLVFHNDRLINYFLPKDHVPFREALNAAVVNLKNQFTANVASWCLPEKNDWIEVLLSDSYFVNYLTRIREEKDIVFGCLIDPEGSYYLQNSLGDEFILLLRRWDTYESMFDTVSEQQLSGTGLLREDFIQGKIMLTGVLNGLPEWCVSEKTVWSGEAVIYSLIPLS